MALLGTGVALGVGLIGTCVGIRCRVEAAFGATSL